MLKLVHDMLRDVGKRGRTPEFWDRRTAERIARHLAGWLATRRSPVHA